MGVPHVRGEVQGRGGCADGSKSGVKRRTFLLLRCRGKATSIDALLRAHAVLVSRTREECLYPSNHGIKHVEGRDRGAHALNMAMLTDVWFTGIVTGCPASNAKFSSTVDLIRSATSSPVPDLMSSSVGLPCASSKVTSSA